MLSDMEIVDPHQHFWQLHRSYPWLQRPVDPERFTGDDSAIRRDYMPDDLRRDFAGLNLIGTVHVEACAGDPELEVRWLQSLHEADGLPSAVVAGANLLADDAIPHLERVAELPVVRGVRHILNWHADPNYTYVERNDLLTDRRWLSVFARLAGLGLSFDLQVYPHQLAGAARLAQEFPETLIILNHTGMPLGTGHGQMDVWRRGIDELARQSNTAVKISGLGMTLHPWNADTFRPFVRYAIESFGPWRAMFASNFPVDKVYSDIPTLYGAFDQLCGDLSRPEREALFAGTARRIYRLGPGTDRAT